MKPIVTKKYLALLIQSPTQKVLNILFHNPEKEFSLSDIAKEARVAKPHIGKILHELEILDFITITKLPKIWRIRADQQNSSFIKNKIIYNLHFLYQSGVIEFLNEYFNNPKSIILFGSFRRGEDFSTSDIDIAIETEEVTEYKSEKISELKVFENSIGRNIQIHVFNRKNVDIHVFNNIANGIVLSGFLEVRI